MATWPEEARVAAIAALDTRAYHDGLDITERQAWQLVTDILDAAAPILAEAVAQKILEHSERQHPRDPDHVPTAWDRHFSIAARVAAMAFYTREDELRLAAEAIERGDFVACNPPEVPG